MSLRVPFNRLAPINADGLHVKQACASGCAAGDGPFTVRCHTVLQDVLGIPKALLTTSCTHALEMAALLNNISPGDEVILPSYTFVTVANAFVLRGARPVFVDIRPDTLNIDERLIERAITPRTKAIVVVHYGGVGCEMDTVVEIARRRSIALIEDNAHGLFGKYRGRHLGVFGGLATLSFHETKTYTCGEGGALLVNDPRFMERAEVIREKGTDRARFLRGEVDKYTWIDIGSSYLPADILAAILLKQFENSAAIQSERKRIWGNYFVRLQDWAARNGVQLPSVPPQCEPSYHLFYMLMPSPQQRRDLIQHLEKRHIAAATHYLPLHLSAMGVRFGGKPGDCPVTERVGDQLLRLPLYNSLTREEQDHVIQSVLEFDTHR